MSKLRKNTLQLTLASIAQKVLAFLYFIVLARFIGAEQTGAYFLALSITTIFSVLTDFGLQPVLVREVAKAKANAQELFRTILGAKGILTLIAITAVISFTAVMGYDLEVRQLVAVALAVMALDAITLSMYGFLRGRQILLYESIGMFIGQIFTVISGITFMALGLPLVYLVLALVCGSAWNTIFSTAMVVQREGAGVLALQINWKVFKPILRMAVPFALAGIFVKIYSYVDTITISQFFGDFEVGIYAVAYKLTYAFQFLPLAFVAALYPAMSEQVENNKSELSKTLENAMVYMMVLAVPIVFGIWATASEIISFTVGVEFLAATVPLQVLVFVLLTLFLDFPIGSLLNAANRQTLKTVLTGITMVINVALNLLLVPRIGVVGASIAANVSFAFLLVSGWYFASRIVQISWGSLLGKLARILLIGVIMAVVARVLVDIHLVVAIVGAAGVYGAGLLLARVVSIEQLRSMLSR